MSERNINFDKTVNRKNTDCLKYDFALRRGMPEDVLPLWVADMDFKTSSYIEDALIERTKHAIFGYTETRDEYFAAVQGWMKRHHNWDVKRQWLVKTPGVVPALAFAVKAYTNEGDGVLIQQPVYYPFSEVISDSGRKIVSNDLVLGEDNKYHIDFELFDEMASRPQTTMLILCNPHNPVGKIWDRETLARIGDVCMRHHVIVVSDEIHCDLTAAGKEYIPFASVSEACRNNSVMCIAPTKAFNLAGLQTSAVVVPDRFLYNKVNRGLNTDEVAEPNSFAVQAAVAAFTHGADWLDALRGYIDNNRRITAEFIEKEIPDITYVPSEATYLLWLCCGDITGDSRELAEFIRHDTGLYLSDGAQYGRGGEEFLRLNIACPRSVLEDGLNRLKQGIEDYRAK